MDLATIIGIVVGLVCIVLGILNNNGNLMAFFEVSSIFIVLGGGIASTLISYKLSEITKIMKVAVKAFQEKEISPYETITLLLDMSQKARREGLLALEAGQENIKDEYLKKSLELVVDGVEPEIIRDSMNLELDNLRMRHKKGQGLFKTMAALFPAWGMIGTLIGLIKLLGALDDPAAIGPSMAVALITTLYGSVLANYVCTPIANKLDLKSSQEIQLKEMIIEGVLSIQAGENPRIMEHRLTTFLSPEQKAKFAVDNSGDGSRGNDEDMAS